MEAGLGKRETELQVRPDDILSQPHRSPGAKMACERRPTLPCSGWAYTPTLVDHWMWASLGRA